MDKNKNLLKNIKKLMIALIISEVILNIVDFVYVSYFTNLVSYAIVQIFSYLYIILSLLSNVVILILITYLIKKDSK